MAGKAENVGIAYTKRGVRGPTVKSARLSNAARQKKSKSGFTNLALENYNCLILVKLRILHCIPQCWGVNSIY